MSTLFIQHQSFKSAAKLQYFNTESILVYLLLWALRIRLPVCSRSLRSVRLFYSTNNGGSSYETNSSFPATVAGNHTGVSGGRSSPMKSQIKIAKSVEIKRPMHQSFLSVIYLPLVTKTAVQPPVSLSEAVFPDNFAL